MSQRENLAETRNEFSMRSMMSGCIIFFVFLFLLIVSSCLFNNNQWNKVMFTINVVEESEESKTTLFDTTVDRGFWIHLSHTDDFPIKNRTILTRVYLNGRYHSFIDWPAAPGGELVSKNYKGPKINFCSEEGVLLTIAKKDLKPGEHVITIESSLYNYPWIFWGTPLVKKTTEYRFYVPIE